MTCYHAICAPNYQWYRLNVDSTIASHLPRYFAKIVLTRQNVPAETAKNLAVRIAQMIMKIGSHVNYASYNLVILVVRTVKRMCFPVTFVILFTAVSDFFFWFYLKIYLTIIYKPSFVLLFKCSRLQRHVHLRYMQWNILR